MAYTFGAATSDDITFNTGAFNPSGDGSIFLLTGWWHPTTLTAGRCLWATGSRCKASIDAVTTDLVLNSGWTTTDSAHTVPVDLVVDKWQFLAFLFTSENTGDVVSWRVWAGDLENAPVEKTVTQITAAVGSQSTSSPFTLGNNGSTGTNAFQGDIDDITIHAMNTNVGGTRHVFGVSSAGVITNDNAQFVYERFVLPHWLGQAHRPYGSQNGGYPNTSGNEQLYSLSLNTLPIVRLAPGSSVINPFIAIVPAGGSYSQRRGPRPVVQNPHMPTFLRR